METEGRRLGGEMTGDGRAGGGEHRDASRENGREGAGKIRYAVANHGQAVSRKARRIAIGIEH